MINFFKSIKCFFAGHIFLRKNLVKREYSEGGIIECSCCKRKAELFVGFYTAPEFQADYLLVGDKFILVNQYLSEY